MWLSLLGRVVLFFPNIKLSNKVKKGGTFNQDPNLKFALGQVRVQVRVWVLVRVRVQVRVFLISKCAY